MNHKRSKLHASHGKGGEVNKPAVEAFDVFDSTCLVDKAHQQYLEIKMKRKHTRHLHITWRRIQQILSTFTGIFRQNELNSQ